MSICEVRESFCVSHNLLFRSEEHTSELQSQSNLVCRLLLEKKKIMKNTNLSNQQHVSEIMLPLITQSHTARQYLSNDQIHVMTHTVSADVALVHKSTTHLR